MVAHIALSKIARRVDGSAQPVSDATPLLSQTISSFSTTVVSTIISPNTYSNMFWVISIDSPAFIAFSSSGNPDPTQEPRYYLPTAGQYAYRTTDKNQKVAIIAA